MNINQNEAFSATQRTKTSILTGKYPKNGVNEWSAPILNLQATTGFSRVDGLGKPIGDPPIHLDSSSVSEGTL